MALVVTTYLLSVAEITLTQVRFDGGLVANDSRTVDKTADSRVEPAVLVIARVKSLL